MDPDAPHTVTTADGVTFRRMPPGADAVYVVGEYHFDDIRPDDIVIDIGANVGAFCIRAARRAGRVLAVEPVLAEVLRENVRANGAGVTVVAGALGDGGRQRIAWGGGTVTVTTRSLGAFADAAGGCDFLKCDCEGAEWTIRPQDLDSVRRIEMELHMPPIGGAVNRRLLDYIGKHYDFTIERTPGYDVRGVMGVLHAVRRGGR
ncbi:FkbM family methyltransferase [Methanoculleus sp. Wushi-C6]|uniref:FkbM family methyltransferase n=1 Tax=Methanoculleus caldifontis TaxID=2651577 RepID=A0ABU3X3T8_9EURY|nr:FkbM family methyltransferase [Methanoculleus sp. Wushi-C6]MDV2482725.1 FkbM family methyltransferase [Methanoculleus sp. Wushi-C6]